MWKRRGLEITGELLIGDGIVSLLLPTGHMRLWRDVSGARWWRASVDWFADHPQVTRIVGGAELAAGVWLNFHASGDLA